MDGVLERFKRMWLGWQGIAQGILRGQNLLLMTVAYFVGLTPVAVAFRLAGRQLIDRSPADPAAKSYWNPRDGQPRPMDQASRQF